MAILNKTATDSVFILLPEWINRFKGVLFLPLIIGAIGIEEYGVYVLIIANVMLLTPLAHLALGQSLIRFMSECTDRTGNAKQDAFWTTLISVFCLSVAAMLLYLVFAPVINDYVLDSNHLGSIYLSIPLVSANALLIIFLCYLNSQERFKASSLYRLFSNLVPYIGFVVGVVIDRKLQTGLLYQVVILWVFLIMQLIRLLPEVGKPCFVKVIIAKYIRFSLPLAAANFSNGNIDYAPKLFIPLFLDSSALGLFNIMYMVVRLITSFSEPFMKILNVKLPRIWDSGDYHRVGNILDKSVTMYLIFTVLACVTYVFFLIDVMRLFFPDMDIPDVSQSIPVLVCLALFAIVYGLNVFVRIEARLKHQPASILYSSIVTLVCNVCISFFFIKYFGLAGAAATLLLSMMVYQGVLQYLVNSSQTRNIFLLLLKFTIPLAGIAVSIHFARQYDLFYMVVTLLAGLCVYFLLIHITRIITLSDFQALVLESQNRD